MTLKTPPRINPIIRNESVDIEIPPALDVWPTVTVPVLTEVWPVLSVVVIVTV